jgi:S1-C subfamily serine protease
MGAVIDVVAEGSPAFVANVIPGDVLIELNGVAVTNAQHAIALMQAVPSTATKCTVKVLRKGRERVIEFPILGD